jgi:cold shock CspA family protein
LEKTSLLSFDDLQQDQPVEFTPIEGPKGARAIEVRPL